MSRNGNGNGNGKPRTGQQIRCAIYTRKSTEEGLEQEFNSLDAQREAGEAYVASQKAEGWACLPDRYDDGGFTGGNMERPALRRLLTDIDAGGIDCVVVYKVDRLSRSLMDFARMMETFDKHQVSFVSVTQQFNTTHSMGRLTLNILLSFAQFEREIISERTRDKIAATRRKGKWSGGRPILGYDVDHQAGRLVVNSAEAERVRAIFDLYLQKQSLIQTVAELNGRGWTTKRWTTHEGETCGGRRFDKSSLRNLLTNVLYVGKVRYKDEVHVGEQEAIVDNGVWQQASQMLHANGRTGGMHLRNKYGALLKGLLYCQPCGLRMTHSYTVRSKQRCYRYYVCQTAQKQGWHACPSKSLPAEQIEQFVVEQIRAIGQDPALLEATLAQVQAQDAEHVTTARAETRALERELERLHREIHRTAKTAGGNGDSASSLADLHDRAGRAERRLAELRTEMAAVEGRRISEAELREALVEFDQLWGTLSPREQARVLRLLVQQVAYDGVSGKVAVTFRPSGLNTLGRGGVPAKAEVVA